MNDRLCECRADYVAAAALFVSSEPTRYYLNGIHIEPHPTRGVFIVATDGHRMAVLHDPAGSTNGKWICPVPKQIAKAASGDTTVRFEGDRSMIMSKQRRVIDVHEPAIDGMFPDWRGIFKRHLRESRKICEVRFDGGYLGSFVEAAKLLGAAINGTLTFAAVDPSEPTLVRIEDIPAFVGLLMPVRISNPRQGIADFMPDWLPVGVVPT